LSKVLTVHLVSTCLLGRKLFTGPTVKPTGFKILFFYLQNKLRLNFKIWSNFEKLLSDLISWQMFQRNSVQAFNLIEFSQIVVKIQKFINYLEKIVVRPQIFGQGFNLIEFWEILVKIQNLNDFRKKLSQSLNVIVLTDFGQDSKFEGFLKFWWHLKTWFIKKKIILGQGSKFDQIQKDFFSVSQYSVLSAA
jgi:hypothetical protein